MLDNTHLDNTQTAEQPLVGEFDDFDRFADATRGWNIEFRQLDRGQLSAKVFQVCSRDSVLMRVKFSRALDQRGCAPAGFFTFGLLDNGDSSIRWCGREATDRTLLAFDTRSGFDAISRPGFGAFTYSVSREALAQAAEMLELAEFDSLLGAASSYSAGQIQQIAAIKSQMRDICESTVRDASLANNVWLREELDFELPGQLLSVVASASDKLRGDSSSSRLVALNKARAFIRDKLDQAPTVRQICEHTGVSWRTLNYAFREHFGMTAQSYLKAVRLDEARRWLRSGSCATVAEAANHCGFWHMGKFAADYRSQFAELPSEALRRISA